MTPPARRTPPRKKGSIGGGNPVADDVEHTPPVSPLAGAEWTPRAERPVAPAVEFQPAEAVVVTGRVVPALRIPDPQDPETDDDTLTDSEKKRLEAYEAALDRHRDAWWEEGKALAGIVQGKLHRQDYPSLEAYLDDRCEGMSRPVAYRRMELWPLGERLSPMGDRFNERQARALGPYWKTRGQAAAEVVYRTIAETEGVKVTAKLVEQAVNVLPDGDYDEAETIGRIRAFLAGELQPAAPAAPAAVTAERFTVSLNRARTALRRIARPDVVRAIAEENPEAVKEFAEELRRLADEMENAGE